MLFKLSLGNIRRSVRDYAVYFFTLVIGVSVFYVFNAVSTQTALLNVMDTDAEIVELLGATLSGMSVFVAVVLGLLVVYASRFLMKRRSREFALYMLMGMGKGSVSAILVMETLIVGVFSLCAGLLLGVGLSQLMSALVVNLFEADMTAYRFTFSVSAAVKTVLFFAVIYVVAMLFSGVVVSRFRLIDLMQSGRKSERAVLKSPVLCAVVLILASAVLGYAYYRVGWTNIGNETRLLVMIALGSVSTFFIFWSASGLLLRAAGGKNRTLRGLNIFTFRQIAGRVNTAVVSMTVICLMLFITICALSAAFSVRNSINKNLKELCPADAVIGLTLYEEEGDGVIPVDVVEWAAETGRDLTAEFAEYVHFHGYVDPDFSYEAFLADRYEEITEDYGRLKYETLELYTLSDYNRLMTFYGREPLVLDEGEYALVCDFGMAVEQFNRAVKKGWPLTVFGHTLVSRYDGCADGFIDIGSQHLNMGFAVVPDSAVDPARTAKDYLIGQFGAADKEEEQAAAERLQAQVRGALDAGKREDIRTWLNFNTRLEVKRASVGIGALITFLCLYLGLVFLISCGAVLALKELSGYADTAGQYEILRKIGAEEEDLSRSVNVQTGIVFLLPLLLAAVHSVFGMKFAIRFLEMFGTEDLGVSILITVLILLLLYGGYYLITSFTGREIIRDKK